MIRSIRFFYNDTPTRWRKDIMRANGRTVHVAWLGPVFVLVASR